MLLLFKVFFYDTLPPDLSQLFFFIFIGISIKFPENNENGQ